MEEEATRRGNMVKSYHIAAKMGRIRCKDPKDPPQKGQWGDWCEFRDVRPDVLCDENCVPNLRLELCCALGAQLP